MALGRSIDPDIEQFAQDTIDSFVTWDLLVFFHDWQGFSADARTIATDIGRSRSEVEPALRRLVALEILKTSAGERDQVYSYAPDIETAQKIDRFASLLEQRELRLSLLASLLRKGIR